MNRYQQEIDDLFAEYKWSYWSPLAILARLFEESGEFARLVNHVYGEKKKKHDECEQDLEDEMGDIFYTLICFANANGLDVDRAIRKSIDKVRVRDKDRFPEGR